MAISTTLAYLLRHIQSILPRGGSLLEIGEANWYDPSDASQVPGCTGADDMFAVAKAFYRELFDPCTITSIDMNGTEVAIRHDLNSPLPGHVAYDVVMNHGTAEHVFNIAQVFATIHDCCKVGGLMIHESPFTGWLDHGFYCLQPTLFYDLAAANGYEIEVLAVEEIKSQTVMIVPSREQMTRMLPGIANNALIFAAMRKRNASGFVLPVQGYYSKTIGGRAVDAWHELR